MSKKLVKPILQNCCLSILRKPIWCKTLGYSGQGPSIFQLFSSEDEPLLIWRNSFLVLDLGLDILDGVGRFNLQGNGLSSQCFDKDLHRLKKRIKINRGPRRIVVYYVVPYT